MASGMMDEKVRSNGTTCSDINASTTIPALMAMADFFLCQNPKQIEESIHCLLACLSLSPPPRVEVKIELQLGLLFYHHSNNLLEARQILEQAVLTSKNIPGLEQFRYEAASILSRIHIEQGYPNIAKKVLKNAMETSHEFPYWHCRLLLQKADVHVHERDVSSLISTLTLISDYALHVQSPWTHIIFMINKGAQLLIHKQYSEASNVLSSCCSLVDGYSGPRSTELKAYYLVIQVTHLLEAGLIKAAKPHLKQLQQCVKVLMSNESEAQPTGEKLTANSLEWFSKGQIYILAHLISVMHSLLSGQIKKAIQFGNYALEQISHSNDGTSSSVMNVFRAHLLELVIISTLITGQSIQSGQKLQEVLDICHGHSSLMYSHRAILHTLLGLYAFATNDLHKSVIQFQTALKHTNNLELQVFINLNIAVTFMKLGPEKENELLSVMELLQSENVNSLSCNNLKGAIELTKGLYAFNQLKFHEAKRHLRDTLSISNGNDLHKLTAYALVILGQIFLSLSNKKETKDMIDQAFHVSSRIPEIRLQEWSASLLVELNHANGNKEAEIASIKTLHKIQDEINNDCQSSVKSSHHALIQWTVGDWPFSHKPDISDEEMETDGHLNEFDSSQEHIMTTDDYSTPIGDDHNRTTTDVKMGGSAVTNVIYPDPLIHRDQTHLFEPKSDHVTQPPLVQPRSDHVTQPRSRDQPPLAQPRSRDQPPLAQPRSDHVTQPTSRDQPPLAQPRSDNVTQPRSRDQPPLVQPRSDHVTQPRSRDQPPLAQPRSDHVTQPRSRDQPPLAQPRSDHVTQPRSRDQPPLAQPRSDHVTQHRPRDQPPVQPRSDHVTQPTSRDQPHLIQQTRSHLNQSKSTDQPHSRSQSKSDQSRSHSKSKSSNLIQQDPLIEQPSVHMTSPRPVMSTPHLTPLPPKLRHMSSLSDPLTSPKFDHNHPSIGKTVSKTDKSISPRFDQIDNTSRNKSQYESSHSLRHLIPADPLIDTSSVTIMKSPHQLHATNVHQSPNTSYLSHSVFNPTPPRSSNSPYTMSPAGPTPIPPVHMTPPPSTSHHRSYNQLNYANLPHIQQYGNIQSAYSSPVTGPHNAGFRSSSQPQLSNVHVYDQRGHHRSLSPIARHHPYQQSVYPGNNSVRYSPENLQQTIMGYSALSPEAILSQRMQLMHRQQSPLIGMSSPQSNIARPPHFVGSVPRSAERLPELSYLNPTQLYYKHHR